MIAGANAPPGRTSGVYGDVYSVKYFHFRAWNETAYSGYYHNHGRVINVPVSKIRKCSSGRPVVYTEGGSNEPWPFPGQRGLAADNSGLKYTKLSGCGTGWSSEWKVCRHCSGDGIACNTAGKVRIVETKRSRSTYLFLNRANAALSAGPKSPRGKAVARANSTLHCLTAIPEARVSENLAEFRRMLRAVAARLGPRDVLEGFLANGSPSPSRACSAPRGSKPRRLHKARAVSFLSGRTFRIGSSGSPTAGGSEWAGKRCPIRVRLCDEGGRSPRVPPLIEHVVAARADRLVVYA